MGRKSLTDWKEIVERQISSGLTAAEFCRQNNHNQKYFSQYNASLKKCRLLLSKLVPR
jgi:hypothetical protein